MTAQRGGYLHISRGFSMLVGISRSRGAGVRSLQPHVHCCLPPVPRRVIPDAVSGEWLTQVQAAFTKAQVSRTLPPSPRSTPPLLLAFSQQHGQAPARELWQVARQAREANQYSAGNTGTKIPEGPLPSPRNCLPDSEGGSPHLENSGPSPPAQASWPIWVRRGWASSWPAGMRRVTSAVGETVILMTPPSYPY